MQLFILCIYDGEYARDRQTKAFIARCRFKRIRLNLFLSDPLRLVRNRYTYILRSTISFSLIATRESHSWPLTICYTCNPIARLRLFPFNTAFYTITVSLYLLIILRDCLSRYIGAHRRGTGFQRD